MTNEEPLTPYYRSPSAIRSEEFTHRMRGLDEAEVREYLDLIASQVEAADRERAQTFAQLEQLRSDNERLSAELQRVRADLAEQEAAGDRVNEQAVELFSQAQLVAEEMIETVTRDARERLGQARTQEQKILQEALEAAEKTRREAEAAIARATGSRPRTSTFDREIGRSVADAGAATAELEHVRSFARVAQAQMQSIMDALAAQVERLGDTPAPGRPMATPPEQEPAAPHEAVSFDSWPGWKIDAANGDRSDPWSST